jgi:hypothetical protein
MSQSWVPFVQGCRVGGTVGVAVGAYDAHAYESTPYPHVPVPYMPDCAHAAGLEVSAPHAVHDSDVPLQDAPV